METNLFRGTGVALATPFKADLEVDFQGLERLLKHTQKLDYFVVNGTTGESPTVNLKERQNILSFVAEHNAGNLPVLYGMGGNNTQRVLHQLEKTDFSHIQGILSVCPYYNKPTQEGLFQHFSRIADHAPVPVILYNVPGRTSCNLEVETTLRLAEHPNILGIKEAAQDLNQIQKIGKYKPQQFLLISGDDMNTLAVMRAGGSGVISVLANAFPYFMKSLVDACFEGQWQQAQDTLEVLLPINPLMYKESNPVGIKKILEILGICGPQVRLPLVVASDTLDQKIRQACHALMENKKSGG
ncbi:MAG: 4-hydroxy-tetrahydrodipicolinate synthase [Cyclobacteriaceae bacterium]|nr:4-hydroxy-tetrahydrodipicolinate synthase [Cyclobacteriaceae bacterium]